MIVLGVVMVKDEEDVIEDLVRHAFSERMDAVLVADNLSTDWTWGIVRALQEEFPTLGLVTDDEPAYFQSRKMTDLANEAVEMFAGPAEEVWVVPMDADELWYHPEMPLGDHLRCLGPQVAGVHCSMWNHYVTDADEDEEESPFRRMVWRHWEQNPLHKVCYRWSPELVIEQGNHHVRGVETEWTGAAIRHFPYRSGEHFVKKAVNGKAAYDAAGDALRGRMGEHWRSYGRIVEEHGADGASAWFREHFTYSGEQREADMIRDPAPLRRWEEL